jgi:hypothetical protein
MRSGLAIRYVFSNHRAMRDPATDLEKENAVDFGNGFLVLP